MTKNKIGIVISSLVAAAGILVAAPAFAQTVHSSPQGLMHGQGEGMFQSATPGIFGVVTAINGNVLSVQRSVRNPGQATTTTTFSVNASGAIIYKNNATTTLSAISVGDTVLAEGPIAGTTITARVIRDGIPQNGKPEGKPGMPLMQGNGQPVIAGKISTINGTTITLTTAASSTTYTIDASQATILAGPTKLTVSSLSVGDYVIVQGTINGTNVTAVYITDIMKNPLMGTSTPGHGKENDNGKENNNGKGPGFFGSVGNFFKHLFGF